MAARRSPTKALLKRLHRRPGHALFLVVVLAAVGYFSRVRSPRSETLRGVTIVIDPGHGGADPGAVCEGVAEAALTYRTAATLARILQSRGATTVFTVQSEALTESGDLKMPRDASAVLSPGRVLQSSRVNPEDVYIRADLAAQEWDRRSHRVLFLSLHYDSRSPGVRGSHTLFDRRSAPSRLARQVARQFSEQGMCGTFPPTPTAQTLGVLWEGRNPVRERTLVECAVLSDAADREKAKDPRWRERLCNLLADAVEETVGK